MMTWKLFRTNGKVPDRSIDEPVDASHQSRRQRDEDDKVSPKLKHLSRISLHSLISAFPSGDVNAVHK